MLRGSSPMFPVFVKVVWTADIVELRDSQFEHVSPRLR
jgi:hypothetical protein